MSSKANEAIDGLKSGINGIHGVGDQIRGTMNSAVDQAFDTPEGEVHNRAVAEKGRQDMEDAGRKLNRSLRKGDTAGHHEGLRIGGISGTGVPTTASGQAPAAGAHSGPVGSLGQDAPTGTTTSLGSKDANDVTPQEEYGTNARY